VSVTFHSNLPKVKRRLEERSDDLAQRTAEGIAEGAASRAPVDQGDLRDSYTAEGGKVYAEWYWALVEFGTVNHGPQPHLMPAAEAAVAKVVHDRNSLGRI
jgi:HK97 gp10 family phage protein